MWEGPAETLTLTENAQPALMAVSLAAMRVLETEAGVDLARDAKFVAGHSLGEYSALAAAGSLTLADAVRLVRIRGRAMQQAVPVGIGAMAALLGVDFEQAAAIAAEAAQGELVQAANDNGGGQVVVSGHKAAVERAVEIAKAKGVRRAMLLPVSAPFHCALMQPAAEVMAEALAKVTIKPPVRAARRQCHGRAGDRSGADRARPGRAGHRHRALARVGRLHGGGRRHDLSTRSAPARCCPAWSSGSPRARAACRSARRTMSPPSRPRAEPDRESCCKEAVHVRSDRQDRARHRRDRRHRRRDRAGAASARARRSRSPARGARRSTRSPASSKRARPCAAVQSRRQGRGRGAGAARRKRRWASSTSWSPMPASPATICSSS